MNNDCLNEFKKKYGIRPDEDSSCREFRQLWDIKYSVWCAGWEACAKTLIRMIDENEISSI